MLPGNSAEESLGRFAQVFERLLGELEGCVAGQREVLEHLLLALFSGGHVLIEGLPGLGKTLMVKSLAALLELRFHRVQCTPDLMPSDILGVAMVVDDGRGHHRFRFEPGPVFCHLLLCDEINRATPKTQSALLEAMQEGQVSVAGSTRPLPQPFFVLATQNPLEMEGTYPLPEAQLDRFQFKLLMPFPSEQALVEILRMPNASAPGRVLPRFLDAEGLLAWREFVRSVPVPEFVMRRAAGLILGTHPHHPSAPEAVRKYVRCGASPRAGQLLLAAACVRAASQGRPHVSTEDVVALTVPCLRHRLVLHFEAAADGKTADEILEALLAEFAARWKRHGGARE